MKQTFSISEPDRLRYAVIVCGDAGGLGGGLGGEGRGKH